MKTFVVKGEYVKATGSFIGGIILNYLVDFKKECKSSNFNVNLKNLKEVTMLDVSELTLRREIKKLEKLGFVLVEKDKKKHSYKINEEKLKEVFVKIGAIEEVEQFIKEEEVVDYDGKLYEQIDVECAIKKVREKNHELNHAYRHHDDNINKAQSQDKITENNEIKKVENYLKNRIDYGCLVERNKNEFEAGLFERMYRIILEVVTSETNSIRINGNNVPSEVVKSVFNKINSQVLLNLACKLKRLSKKIINFKGYIITSIYNTYIESSFELQNDL